MISTVQKRIVRRLREFESSVTDLTSRTAAFGHSQAPSRLTEVEEKRRPSGSGPGDPF